MPDLTLERLRELLSYEPDTGIFRCKTTAWARKPIGSEIGQLVKGYRLIGIDGKYYRAHRLAWLYVYGEWPKHVIDHINGRRSDNRMCNLRDVPHSVNMENRRGATLASKTGVLGVYPRGKRFGASIRHAQVTTHLGTFDTIEQAQAAYLKKKRELHVGCRL